MLTRIDYCFSFPASGEDSHSRSEWQVRAESRQMGIAYSSGFNVDWMVSNTPSKFCNTSTFQNRNTWNPAASSALVRFSSYSVRSECCPPSSSITTCADKAAKSATYPPIGTWRRNLTPAIWRLRRRDHRIASGSVWFLRRDRAKAFGDFIWLVNTGAKFFAKLGPHLPHCFPMRRPLPTGARRK
jgi:hypothetical protein